MIILDIEEIKGGAIYYIFFILFKHSLTIKVHYFMTNYSKLVHKAERNDNMTQRKVVKW